MAIKLPKNEFLRVKVIPKSPKNEITEIMESDEGVTVKVRIRAVPEKGKANAELIKFLSKESGVPKENISILSGKTEQLKLIKIKWN